jgi:hypothetical protein
LFLQKQKAFDLVLLKRPLTLTGASAADIYRQLSIGATTGAVRHCASPGGPVLSHITLPPLIKYPGAWVLGTRTRYGRIIQHISHITKHTFRVASCGILHLAHTYRQQQHMRHAHCALWSGGCAVGLQESHAINTMNRMIQGDCRPLFVR